MGKIRYLLFAKDYLHYRMTGTMETDTIDAAGSMFYNVRRECWSEELCSPTDLVGTVTGERAREFGLAEEQRPSWVQRIP